MKNWKYIKSAMLVIFCSAVLTTSTYCFDRASAEPAKPVQQTAAVTSGTIAPLSVVANPKAYLNKKIVMNAKFDKFSTLGLDYKPAFKSSEDYITFLVKRDDTKFDIPLSEMKLFLKRTEAEKFLELKTDDEIQVTGTLFSDALGDSWIDVEKLVVTKKAPEKDGVK